MRYAPVLVAILSGALLCGKPAIAEPLPLTKERCKDVCQLGTRTVLTDDNKKLFNECADAKLCDGQRGGADSKGGGGGGGPALNRPRFLPGPMDSR